MTQPRRSQSRKRRLSRRNRVWTRERKRGAMPVKKRRVYEVAKDMGMSSEALVHILKSLSVEVKSHMSSVADEVIEQVRSKLAREKEAVKEEEARKREKAVLAAKAEAARRGVPPGRGPGGTPFKPGGKP